MTLIDIEIINLTRQISKDLLNAKDSFELSKVGGKPYHTDITNQAYQTHIEVLQDLLIKLQRG